MISLIYSPCSLQAESPVLISFYVRDRVSPVAGVLREETPLSYTVLDLRTYQEQTFRKEELFLLKKPASEQDVVAAVGLAPTASYLIANALPARPKTGRIASIDSSVAYINLGEDAGIKKGDRLYVFRNKGEILDPESGEVLGDKEARIAVVEVLELQLRLSKVKLITDLEVQLEVGDSVRPVATERPIAVLPFGNTSGRLVQGGIQLSEEIISALSKNEVTVVERSLLASVLDELSLTETGAFDPEIAQKVGSLLRAQAVVVGSIQFNQRDTLVNVRLIEVESGKILFATSLKAKDINSTPVYYRVKQAIVPVHPIMTRPAHNPPVISITVAPGIGNDSGWSVLRTFGQESPIRGIAYSPDGTLLATGHSDKAIRLWAVASGQLLRVLQGHENYIRSVAFSPDGRILASGSIDASAKLWSIPDGRLLRTLQGHKSYIKSAVFSPDGNLVATAAWDRTIKLWSPTSGQLITTFSTQSNVFEAVAFSPSGSLLASAGFDDMVKLWSIPDGQIIQTMSGHTQDVSNVTFSSDGQFLASASKDGTVKLWLIPSGQLSQTLASNGSEVVTVAFHPNNRMLASGGKDNTIKIWSIPDGRLMTTLVGHGDVVIGVMFSLDGRILASGSLDKTIKLWNVPGF